MEVFPIHSVQMYRGQNVWGQAEFSHGKRCWPTKGMIAIQPSQLDTLCFRPALQIKIISPGLTVSLKFKGEKSWMGWQCPIHCGVFLVEMTLHGHLVPVEGNPRPMTRVVLQCTAVEALKNLVLQLPVEMDEQGILLWHWWCGGMTPRWIMEKLVKELLFCLCCAYWEGRWIGPTSWPMGVICNTVFDHWWNCPSPGMHQTGSWSCWKGQPSIFWIIHLVHVVTNIKMYLNFRIEHTSDVVVEGIPLWSLTTTCGLLGVWKGIGPLSLGSLILCGEMCLGLIQIFLHNPFCEVSLALFYSFLEANISTWRKSQSVKVPNTMVQQIKMTPPSYLSSYWQILEPSKNLGLYWPHSKPEIPTGEAGFDPEV